MLCGVGLFTKDNVRHWFCAWPKMKNCEKEHKQDLRSGPLVYTSGVRWLVSNGDM